MKSGHLRFLLSIELVGATSDALFGVAGACRCNAHFFIIGSKIHGPATRAEALRAEED